MDEELFYKEQTVLPPAQQATADAQCDRLRMKFISDWSLKRDLNLYRTEVERDWAFIVKREYRYIVLGRSVGDGIFAGSLLWSAAIFQAKAMRFWPLATIPFFALVRKPSLFRKHNRRLFEMLNVGTEYELGAERNRVLEECNRIAHRADF